MKTSRLSSCELVGLYNDRTGSVNGNRQNAVAKELFKRGIITLDDVYFRRLIEDCRFAPDAKEKN
jgi:hypothetical protein